MYNEINNFAHNRVNEFKKIFKFFINEEFEEIPTPSEVKNAFFIVNGVILMISVFLCNFYH